jgi:hypothetical protein
MQFTAIGDRRRVWQIPYMRSDDSAVGAQHLAIDPATVPAGEERHHIGDVLGLAQPFHLRGFPLSCPDDGLSRFRYQATATTTSADEVSLLILRSRKRRNGRSTR